MNITIMVLDANKRRSLATASANPHVLSPPEEHCWWISRVFVHEKHRGAGLGSKVTKILVSEISKQGGRYAIVTPGGYGAETARQIKFYESLGFNAQEDRPGVWVLNFQIDDPNFEGS